MVQTLILYVLRLVIESAALLKSFATVHLARNLGGASTGSRATISEHINSPAKEHTTAAKRLFQQVPDVRILLL